MLQMVNEVLSVIFLFDGTYYTLQNERIEQVLVCYMHVLFYLPRLTFAVRTPVVSPRYNLVVPATKNALAFFAFSRVVDGNAVADRTSYQLIFEERLLANPLLVDRDKFRLKYLPVHLLLLCSLLHAIYL
jgi:hypothetical protein